MSISRRGLLATALTAPFARQPAMAEPPPGSIGPHGAWFKSLRNPDNVSCCDENDCRRVAARSSPDGRWEVLVTEELFGRHAPNNWVPVPPDRVIERYDNPTGSAVACWSPGYGFFCFFPKIGS